MKGEKSHFESKTTRGEDIEGRRMIGGARRSAGVAHEGGEFGDEGTQTVSGRSVFSEVRVDFLKRGRRALGRCDRIIVFRAMTYGSFCR
jgi:hypothetical protein